MVGSLTNASRFTSICPFFGSLNFFGVSVLGEYLAKVFEEVKQRPLFVRRAIIRDGEIRKL